MLFRGSELFPPRGDGLPSGVSLPTYLVEGRSTGRASTPASSARGTSWQVNRDPNARDPDGQPAALAPGLTVDLGDRLALLEQVNRQQEWLANSAEGRRLSDQQKRAFTVLTSGKVARAFEMDREPAHVRDRYGRHSFGQSLLLARRLIQAGVPVVQANMGRVQNWDSHNDIFSRLKRDLLPPLDQGVSALLDDMEATGLLEETLVMLLGEFGRTPKLSIQPGTKARSPGRDHWAPCFFGLFAGAGVRGGQVIGKSDKIGAYPATTPYTPDDLGATVYHVLGVDPAADVRDRQNRPVAQSRPVMQSLFSGRN